MSNQAENIFTGASHAEFASRRSEIQSFFLENPPKVETSTTLNGGEIHTYHQTWAKPETTGIEPVQPLQLTVYIPGLQMIAQPNLGNVPEIHMASHLAETATDAMMMMIKPEGQNAAAYTGSAAHPLHDVSLAVAEQISKEISKLAGSSVRAVQVRIVGSSEGSSLAPSVIKHILDKQLQNVSITEFLSVCGGGLAGAESMETTSVAAYLLRNIRANKAVVTPARAGLVRTLSDTSTFVDGRVFGAPLDSDKNGNIVRGGGIDNAVGLREQNLLQDAKNFRAMIMRMIATQLGLRGRVPLERLTAIFQRNPDWRQVAEAGIRTTIIASQNDPFFSATRVQDGIQQLQAAHPDWRPTTVITNLEHADFHAYSQGVAAIAHAAAYPQI